MKRAKRKLGEAAPSERGETRPVPPESTERAPAGPPSAGAAKSVESMLREFSSAGPDTPVPGGSPRGQYDQLWQLSMADPHTGLANQLLLLDINLDNLAEINLDLGYTTGNAVLCEVARRLTSVLRAEDTIGRVGGSELVVVVAVADEQVVDPLLRRLQHTLDERVTEGGQDIRLHSSLGVAVAEDSESAEDVLARADRSTRVSRR